MIYKVCYSKQERERQGLSSSFDYICMDDRHEIRKYIEDNLDKFQKFCDGAATGLIFGYAVEYADDDELYKQPKALLYDHPIATMIWIGIND